MAIKNLIIFYQLIGLLAFLFVPCAFGLSYPTLNVCSEAGFYPFEMRTSAGHWDGYEIELIKRFAHSTNRKINFVDMKFDGLIPAIVANKGCDVVVSDMGINPQREKIILFSVPTYQSAYAGVVRTEDIKKYTSFAALNKPEVRIAVEQGAEAAQYVKQNFLKATILTFEDNAVPINAVITKRADVYVDDNVYCAIAEKRKISKIAYLKPEVFPNNEYSGTAFVFRKSNAALRDEFNRFFVGIEKSGELKKIQKYYFEGMNWIKN